VNKKGFVSLDVGLFFGFIIIVLLVLIGIFIYIYPTFTLQNDVSLLAEQAQRNGGLTSENVSKFRSKVESYNFVKKSNKEIVIEAITDINNYNAVGVNEQNYISKDSGEIINITIKIPSNNRIIKKFTDKSGDYYVFKKSVMSEKF